MLFLNESVVCFSVFTFEKFYLPDADRGVGHGQGVGSGVGVAEGFEAGTLDVDYCVAAHRPYHMISNVDAIRHTQCLSHL